MFPEQGISVNRIKKYQDKSSYSVCIPTLFQKCISNIFIWNLKNVLKDTAFALK